MISKKNSKKYTHFFAFPEIQLHLRKAGEGRINQICF
jgi:hypothetical protein